ncbi:MAG: hypothetical protein ACRDJC_21165 [Thermomicrobiales bacterium]
MRRSSFDALTRLIVAEISRRGVLTTPLAAFGVASMLGAENAAAKKKRKKKKRLRQWILSGGPDPTEEIEVDDDLKVLRNGQIVFEDDNGGDDSHDPIAFKARKGDRLKIVAFDAQANCHRLSPLYLHPESGGSPRKLSDDVPLTCPNVAVGEFFHETFRI